MNFEEIELMWIKVKGKMKLMCQNCERDRIENDG